MTTSLNPVAPDALLARRKALGLTQQAMADALGYHLRGWRMIENGEVAPAHPRQLDLALQMLELQARA